MVDCIRLMEGLQSGEGTAGKLLKDPALYDEARGAIGDIRKILRRHRRGQGHGRQAAEERRPARADRATIGRIDLLLDKINSGQGTVGQLLVNTQLYDNLNGATRELHGLMKDFRANPKKFLRIQLYLF